MQKITILNIPNYYSSYYILGLSQIATLRFAPQAEFSHLNNKPFIAFESEGKVAIIDNDDPVGVESISYQLADRYFATNKLLDRPDYNQPKVAPLFPHYPINISTQYFRLFGLKGIGQIGAKELLRQWYILYRRPTWTNHPYQAREEDYIFFSGSIWKKEREANLLRAQFIQACKSNPAVRFEGGMIPRTDGDLCGVPADVLDKKYTPDEFSQKSARSFLGFNNPAVLDAVSWRLAEYWNYGCLVLSLPFKIDLPFQPIHGESIHFVNSGEELPEAIDFIISNPDYRKKIAIGGKEFFETHGLPHIQATRLLQELKSR